MAADTILLEVADLTFSSYPSYATLPSTGVADILYYAVAEDKYYIWNGSSYVEDTQAFTDLTPYIAYNGIKWKRADVDSNEATRDLQGNLIRSRVATKIRLDITCRPLTQTEARTLLSLIHSEWLTVNYYDPMYGVRRNVQMYANNNPATFLMKQGDTVFWSGVTFPLIEK